MTFPFPDFSSQHSGLPIGVDSFYNSVRDIGLIAAIAIAWLKEAGGSSLS